MDLTLPVIDDTEITKNTRRQGIMLCYPFEAKRLYTWKTPYLIQPKLDGVRCRAIISNGYVTLLSSEANIIEQVPHINLALSKMIPEGNIELDGELYAHGMSFQDIISRTSRSVNYHPDAERIQYHIFDIVESKAQIERISTLNSYGFFKENESIQLVESSLARDITEVMDKYYEYLNNGYEGFVIRDIYSSYQRKRYTGIMKFKPHQTDVWPIIGVQEEISLLGDPKGTLGAFVCVSDGNIFNVGTGLSADEREHYWQIRDSLIGKKLKVKYQALTQGKRIPRFPVAVTIVEE